MMIFYIIYLHLYYSCTVGRGLARYKRTPYISICFHKMIYILYLYHSHIILVLIILFFNNQIVTFKIVTFVLPQMTSNELSMPSSSFNQCVIVFSCTVWNGIKTLGSCFSLTPEARVVEGVVRHLATTLIITPTLM